MDSQAECGRQPSENYISADVTEKDKDYAIAVRIGGREGIGGRDDREGGERKDEVTHSADFIRGLI